MIRAAEWYARGNCLHWLEVDLSLALVVARVDERHRPFDEFHDGDVARRPDLQRSELGCAVDYSRRLVGRHRDHLLKREAEPHELAHHPGEVGHPGSVAGADVDVRGNGV